MILETIDKYLEVHVKNTDYAIPITQVLEIVPSPTIRNVYTGSGKSQIVSVRGKIYPIIDLRLHFNHPSYREELNELSSILKQREQDHKNWLNELESSVREEREFKLAKDPHKCKFGLWYDCFTTENKELNKLLPNFDEPHKKIHGIASTVIGYVENKDYQSAYKLINQTKDSTLKQMIDLFSKTYTLLDEANDQHLVIAQNSKRDLGLLVDKAKNILSINYDHVENLTSTSQEQKVARLEDKIICIIDTDNF